MVTTLVLALWALWGYRDDMLYAFGGGQLRDLGNVTEITPAEIPHNAFVSLRGITEHRGLTQKRVRGLSLGRSEFWYFRLLGSRGVFVEVDSDAERYGITTKVEVAGRAIDPQRDAGYGDLVAAYYNRFLPQERPALRVIQVGFEPGAGKLGFVIAGLFLALLVGSNLWILRGWRRIRAARRGVRA